MKLRWMPAAQAALEEIQAYIGQRSEAQAQQMVEHLIDEAEKLLDAPRMGRKVQPENQDHLRVLGVRPYWLYYRICPDAIEILLVWHYRKQPPQSLG
jgi:plasmid stabilization system protein ParE